MYFFDLFNLIFYSFDFCCNITYCHLYHQDKNHVLETRLFKIRTKRIKCQTIRIKMIKKKLIDTKNINGYIIETMNIFKSILFSSPIKKIRITMRASNADHFCSSYIWSVNNRLGFSLVYMLVCVNFLKN